MYVCMYVCVRIYETLVALDRDSSVRQGIDIRRFAEAEALLKQIFEVAAGGLGLWLGVFFASHLARKGFKWL